MSQIKQSLKLIFSNKNYLVSVIILSLLFISIITYFTNSELIEGNLGKTYLYAEQILMIILSILFASFLAITTYKINYFKQFEKTSSAVGGIGSFLGVIVIGCPACSITIASYIGLASTISLLPLFGLELKVLAVPMLLYANYSTLNHLTVCQAKKKTKL